MQKDIASLQADMQKMSYTLEKQSAQLEEHLAQSAQEAKKLSQTLDDLNRLARQSGADLSIQVEKAVRDVESLKGTQDVYEQRFVQIESLIKVLQEKAPNTPLEPPTEPTPTPSEPEEPALPKGKQESLQAAQKLFKEGTYAEAYAAYMAVAKKWSKSIGTTDAAWYGAGESLAQQKQWNQAMGEYVKVIESFPQSEWVDDCYYKIGLCSMELKNYEDAKIFFNEIVTRYKKSPWHSKAQRKLEEANGFLKKK